MAIVLTGTKTCNQDVAPHLTGAVLTTIMATAVENLTVKQLFQIRSALERVSGASDLTKTVGSFLS